ncbi:rhodanese-like domain-containing protein [uncultured Algibacter sp.]|uniref:rhodanese-like domain-containing protein n=1 Tax=uncultured Algibacter sp. TaxID=298659 RepID=UPI00261232AF|nr:rhodanese-like domain-containing protein [uncultured Algibacter sp.]
MKDYRFFFCLTFIIFFFNCNYKLQNEGLTHVSPKEFKSLIDNKQVQLIDVRKPAEYAQGHIRNAANIDYFSEDFIDSIGNLNIKKPVFIYCRSGKRSEKSIKFFKEVGFVEIYNLQGGLLNWESNNFILHNNN